MTRGVITLLVCSGINVGLCETYDNLCGEHATCIDTPGSFYCLCKPGFQGNGDKFCWEDPPSGVCLCALARVLWGLSQKRLERERGARLQWTAKRKWPTANRLVTWSMTSRDLERSRSWPQNVWGPLSRKRLQIQTRLQCFMISEMWLLGRPFGRTGGHLFCSWCFFISLASFLRRPLTDRRKTLLHDRKLGGLDKLSPKIRGHSPPKWGGGKNMQNFGRFTTTSDFDREYLRNGSPCRKSENTIINYNPFHAGPKNGWTLVHKQQSESGS